MDQIETFAKRLRRLREEHGMSIVQPADAVGASEGTIRQLEGGTVRNPHFALGLRLARHFGVDPYYSRSAKAARTRHGWRTSRRRSSRWSARSPGTARELRTWKDGGARWTPFAERLSRLRREQGFTKLGLANAAGVSEAAIRRLESGINKAPSYAVGLRLADVLGTDFYAFGGVERRR